jgi:hypothetical protein
MKNLFWLLAILLLACGEDDPVVVQDPLTDDEIADLVFMIEEEKLARDVYFYGIEVWDHITFNNISASEQRHMDNIADLLDTYDIPNPTIGKGNGEYNNSELTQLYIDLTAKIDLSLEDALAVGATVEDLDITDLEEVMTRTDRADILSVYSSLQCGSRNHLRAYTSQLKSLGGSYTPQYLTTDEYNNILSTNHESCG